MPSESVFAFRVERRVPGSEWEAASDFLVHVNGVRPQHLVWTAEDGVETSLAFSAEGFVGHQRGVDSGLVEVRGVADGVRELSARAVRFTTDDGPFVLLVDDGRGVPVRSLTWRDQGGSASIAMVPAEQVGHADITGLVASVKASRENEGAGEVGANLLLPTHEKWLSFNVYAVLEFEFAEPTAVDAYVFTSANDVPGRDPAAWTVRGSLDGRFWRNLDDRSGRLPFPERHASRTFGIAAPGAYTHYRIDFHGTLGASELQLSGVRFLAGGRGGFLGHRMAPEPVEFRGELVAAEFVPALPRLPWTEETQLLRVSFGDDEAWAALRAEMREASEEYGDEPYDFVEVIDDPRYQDLTKEQVLELALDDDYPHTFLFVADKTTFTSADHPLLVLDLYDEPGREFRCAPEGSYSVHANLSLANMDYEEFAEAVDEDGIYRGF